MENECNATGSSIGAAVDQAQKKRVLNIKSKRKQNLVKKAHELAQLANLQITIVIYDKEHNAL